jgi:hypothetical protein
MASGSAPTEGPVPVGHLPTGEPYYVAPREMRYDGDRVQCHLCGRWLRFVGGSHLSRTHGWTLEEYRDAFRLVRGATTAAPELSARKRVLMLARMEYDDVLTGLPRAPGVRRSRQLRPYPPLPASHPGRTLARRFEVPGLPRS